jgi:hypothetical protein
MIRILNHVIAWGFYLILTYLFEYLGIHWGRWKYKSNTMTILGMVNLAGTSALLMIAWLFFPLLAIPLMLGYIFGGMIGDHCLTKHVFSVLEVDAVENFFLYSERLLPALATVIAGPWIGLIVAVVTGALGVGILHVGGEVNG